MTGRRRQYSFLVHWSGFSRDEDTLIFRVFQTIHQHRVECKYSSDSSTVWISILVIVVNTAMAAFLFVVFVKEMRAAPRSRLFGDRQHPAAGLLKIRTFY
jgi:hypothetical protein